MKRASAAVSDTAYLYGILFKTRALPFFWHTNPAPHGGTVPSTATPHDSFLKSVAHWDRRHEPRRREGHEEEVRNPAPRSRDIPAGSASEPLLLRGSLRRSAATS